MFFVLLLPIFSLFWYSTPLAYLLVLSLIINKTSKILLNLKVINILLHKNSSYGKIINVCVLWFWMSTSHPRPWLQTTNINTSAFTCSNIFNGHMQQIQRRCLHAHTYNYQSKHKRLFSICANLIKAVKFSHAKLTIKI